jgi:hypothetical protein
VTSIGLAAGARIVQAPGLPPAPAPGACRAALQSGRGHGPQFVAAAPGRAGARRFNRARTHVPDTGHNSRGGRPRPAHAAEPPGPLHLSLAPSSRTAGFTAVYKAVRVEGPNKVLYQKKKLASLVLINLVWSAPRGGVHNADGELSRNRPGARAQERYVASDRAQVRGPPMSGA